MFQVAIRGIPNFSYLQFEMFNTFDELHAKYKVRVRESTFEHLTEIFNSDGKRVILYILPEEHTQETLKVVCGKYGLVMTPGHGYPPTVRMAGTGTAIPGSGSWMALNPEAFPDYTERLEDYRMNRRRIDAAKQAAEEQEEREEAELSRVLNDAIDTCGRAAVLKTLQLMGVRH